MANGDAEDQIVHDWESRVRTEQVIFVERLNGAALAKHNRVGIERVLEDWRVDLAPAGRG